MPFRIGLLLLIALSRVAGVSAQENKTPKPDLLQSWLSMSVDERQRYNGGFANSLTQHQAHEIGLDEAQWTELVLLKEQFFNEWKKMRERQNAKYTENQLWKDIDEKEYEKRSLELSQQKDTEMKLAIQQYATRVQDVLLPSQRLAFDHLALRHFVINNSTPQSVFSIPQALATSLELTGDEQKRLDEAIVRAKAAIQEKMHQARKEAALDIENALSPGQVLTLHELAGETWIEPVFKK